MNAPHRPTPIAILIIKNQEFYIIQNPPVKPSKTRVVEQGMGKTCANDPASAWMAFAPPPMPKAAILVRNGTVTAKNSFHRCCRAPPAEEEGQMGRKAFPVHERSRRWRCVNGNLSRQGVTNNPKREQRDNLCTVGTLWAHVSKTTHRRRREGTPPLRDRNHAHHCTPPPPPCLSYAKVPN